MEPLWLGPCSSGFPHPWKKRLKVAATSWKIAAPAGIESYVRLKPGVTLRQAQEEISSVAKRLEATIRQPTAAAASSCIRYGKLHSTMHTLLLTHPGNHVRVVVFVLLIALR